MSEWKVLFDTNFWESVREDDPVVLACMEHYELDEAFSYSISRAHFLWDEGHADRPRSLLRER